jgi:1-deoxy-D-xylulose-5-phosphate synthase
MPIIFISQKSKVESQKSKVESGKRKVVAVIGDGAMTGGLAFEGLNNASMDKNDLLIVLNDNNMAIDPIKGGFTQYLVDLTTSPRYNKMRWWGYQALVKMHLMSDHKRAKILRFNNNLKATLTKQPKNIFQGLNIRYFGPVDGHDVIGLVRILSEIKNYHGPKVLHIVTQKGKGYAPAEADQTVWHAPGEFDVETGERLADRQKTADAQRRKPLVARSIRADVARFSAERRAYSRCYSRYAVGLFDDDHAKRVTQTRV